MSTTNPRVSTSRALSLSTAVALLLSACSADHGPPPSCEPIRVVPMEPMTRADSMAEAVAAVHMAYPARPVEVLPWDEHGENLDGAEVLVRTGWAGARVNLQHAPQVWLNLDSDDESPTVSAIAEAVALVIPACEAGEVMSG